ncbi:MAG: hypothetical protein GEU90_19335 [Gemmatimonas sp.]|nr:hypothetical protein [Gemmatimonas sp.]
MNGQRDLHIGRLKSGLQRIAELRESRLTPHDADFRTWKERTYHSLGMVFGTEHDYPNRFSWLHFCLPRASIGRGPSWTSEDQRVLLRDLDTAEAILTDALEEVGFVEAMAAREVRAEAKAPSIVVNIQNVLSQTTSITLQQIHASADGPGDGAYSSERG